VPTDTEPPPSGEPVEPAAPGRAGRNLPVAVGVGALMAGVALVTLYTVKAVFLGVVGLAVIGGVYEFSRALAHKKLSAPFIPVAAGSVAILVTSYTSGFDAMTASMLLTIPVLVAWRVVRGPDGLVVDLGVSIVVLLYVGYLTGFAGLMLAPHDGADRVTCFVATVVASDIGGYATGVLFGKHLLAPKISPKKSIEGLVGSTIMCACVGVLLLTWLLNAYWWQGVLFGLATVVTATLGDLGESMVKRDLGIKDMGTLIPGHGGILDRLDSLLLTAPVAWALLAAFVPVH
jgi:phosphatidate cytidylyltransferase